MTVTVNWQPPGAVGAHTHTVVGTARGQLMRMTMPSNRNRGFSLVELMVAVTLAIVTGLAVMMILSVYESRKRTVTVGNDAEMNAAVGMYMVEREVRMAGAGLTGPTGMLCPAGVNLYYNGATSSTALYSARRRVTDGGADGRQSAAGQHPGGPQRLRVRRSALDGRESDGRGRRRSTVDRRCRPRQGRPVAGRRCRRQQGLHADAVDAGAAGGRQRLDARPWFRAGSQYNPADPAAAFTNAVSYDVGDIVVNLGQLGLRTFRVICSDGAAPPSPQRLRSRVLRHARGGGEPGVGAVESISSQVVNFQVQYGVAPVGSQTVNDWWTEAAGGWAAPSAADASRIKAVRMAIVTRGNLEREDPWSARRPWCCGTPGGPTELSIPSSADERHYRYKVMHRGRAADQRHLGGRMSNFHRRKAVSRAA